MSAQHHLTRRADEDPVTERIPRVRAPGEPRARHHRPEVPAAVPHLALLRGRTVVTVAAGVTAVLALAHFGAAVYGIGKPGFEIPAAIRLGNELNVSTWFSSAVHLVNAGLLALLAANSVRRERWKWVLLSVSCAVVAMDETASNHEQVGWIIHTTFGTGGFLTYAWIIPAVVLVTVVALLCAPMVLRRPGGFVVAAGTAVFLLGSVGLESVGGAVFAQTGDVQAFGYNVLAGIEETLEMTGLVIAMAGLLRMAGGSGLRLSGTFVERS